MAAVLERARWTQKPGCRVGLLVLERKRDGFDIGWGTKTRARCESALAAVCAAGGHSWTSLNDGAVRVADDRTLRAALAQAAVEVDVLVATQPTISDGRLAAIVAQAYGGPVVLWATPENPDVRGSVVGGVSSNSLVGTHLFAATMRQLGRKDVDLVYADQDWAAAEAQLAAAVNRAYAAKTLRVAKVGLIGHQAPGFVDLHPDPFCLHKTFGGAVLEHVALDDLIARAKALDAAAVAADMGLAMPGGFANGALAVDEKSSRLYLALKAIVDDENLDAVAIRCWPELPRDYGQWPYLAVTRLADAGFPVACEGDVATPAFFSGRRARRFFRRTRARVAQVDGAVTMLVMKLLGCGAPYISDWLEHDARSFVCWHGGMCPTCLCVEAGAGAPRLAPHFNNKVPTVVDATLKPGMAVTIARLWVCDGSYKLMVCDGATEAPDRPLSGNNGRVALDLRDRGGRDLFACFDDWVVGSGMPHHVVIAEGHHKANLLKFARAHGLAVV